MEGLASEGHILNALTARNLQKLGSLQGSLNKSDIYTHQRISISTHAMYPGTMLILTTPLRKNTELPKSKRPNLPCHVGCRVSFSRRVTRIPGILRPSLPKRWRVRIRSCPSCHSFLRACFAPSNGEQLASFAPPSNVVAWSGLETFPEIAPWA